VADRLNGRVALVTGASSGIGRGVSLAYAAEGALVAINYPDAGQEAAARAVEQAILAAGGRAMTVRADVREETQVAAMIGEVERAYGRLDILVNNAGIARPRPLLEMTLEEWDDVQNVNLRGPFLCAKHALPGMIRRDYGRIINTASNLAFRGRTDYANYTASKAGLIGLTRSMVMEVGARNITVNCVAPTITITPIMQAVSEEGLRAVTARIPKGRLGQVDDLISTFVFLASEDIGYLTGQCLAPSGGDVMA
jgi:3-oxoacyl-[acyl-carrier protein] reductase